MSAGTSELGESKDTKNEYFDPRGTGDFIKLKKQMYSGDKSPIEKIEERIKSIEESHRKHTRRGRTQLKDLNILKCEALGLPIPQELMRRVSGNQQNQTEKPVDKKEESSNYEIEVQVQPGQTTKVQTATEETVEEMSEEQVEKVPQNKEESVDPRQANVDGQHPLSVFSDITDSKLNEIVLLYNTFKKLKERLNSGDNSVIGEIEGSLNILKCQVLGLLVPQSQHQVEKIPENGKESVDPKQADLYGQDLNVFSDITDSNVSEIMDLYTLFRNFRERLNSGDDSVIGEIEGSLNVLKCRVSEVPQSEEQTEKVPENGKESVDPKEASYDGESLLNVSIDGTDINLPSGKPDKMLGTSDFLALLGTKDESYYIDKTKLIEVLISSDVRRLIVTAPRRFGKTVNITMLKAFFELQVSAEETKTLSEENLQIKIQETHNYKLFHEHSLAIIKNLDVMKEHFGKYPVIHVSFECDRLIETFNDAIQFCKDTISQAFEDHKYLVSSTALNSWEREECKKWCNDDFPLVITEQDDVFEILEGLKTLAKYLCKHFDRKIVLLVDEYDSVMMQAIQNCTCTDELLDILSFCTSIIQVVVRENVFRSWLEYAFITGISQFSVTNLSEPDLITPFTHLPSNLRSFKFLRNKTFLPYYGLTAIEARQLLHIKYQFDEQQIAEADSKLSGYIAVGRVKIFNICAVLEYASKARDNQVTYEWQDTGCTVNLHKAFKYPRIMEMIQTKLLLNEPIRFREIPWFKVAQIPKLLKTIGKVDDPQMGDLSYPNCFFSFMFNQGYLLETDKRNHFVIANEQVKKEVEKMLTEFNSKVVGGSDPTAENSL